MRTQPLHEASVENIRVIKQLTGAIWSSLPVVPEGDVYEVALSQLTGFDRIYRMYMDDEKFKPVFRRMATTRLRVVNSLEYRDPEFGQKPNIWGYHSSQRNLLLIWQSNIARRTGGGTRLDAAARSTLAHEIRHLFQYRLYPEYFKSLKAFGKPYERQQIEIDAVWSQTLGSEIDVEYYEGDPEGFAAAVMRRLTATKELTGKERRHYYRKTLKYYHQFYDEDTRARWLNIVTRRAAQVEQDPDYSVENFVGDVIEDLENYLMIKFKNSIIKRQILDHYTMETRQMYKKLTAGRRAERRQNSAIERLMPMWNQTVSRYRQEWTNPGVNSVKLTLRVLGDMDSALTQAAGGNAQLRNRLASWFGNRTRKHIDNSRS